MNVSEIDMTSSSIGNWGSAGETLDRLLRASTYVRMQMSDFLDEFSLTEARFSVLSTLSAAAEKGLSQSELADQLIQSESNVSTLIERMQQDGLVHRLQSDSDRRKRVLRLSSEGQRLFDRVELARQIWASKLLRSFPMDDASTLGRLLARLVENFDVAAGRNKVGYSSPKENMTSSGSFIRHEESIESNEESHSPHLALRQMLSTLGLISQLVEDEA